MDATKTFVHDNPAGDASTVSDRPKNEEPNDKGIKDEGSKDNRTETEEKAEEDELRKRHLGEVEWFRNQCDLFIKPPHAIKDAPKKQVIRSLKAKARWRSVRERSDYFEDPRGPALGEARWEPRRAPACGCPHTPCTCARTAHMRPAKHIPRGGGVEGSHLAVRRWLMRRGLCGRLFQTKQRLPPAAPGARGHAADYLLHLLNQRLEVEQRLYKKVQEWNEREDFQLLPEVGACMDECIPFYRCRRKKGVRLDNNKIMKQLRKEVEEEILKDKMLKNEVAVAPPAPRLQDVIVAAAELPEPAITDNRVCFSYFYNKCEAGTQTWKRHFRAPASELGASVLFGRLQPTRLCDAEGARLELAPLDETPPPDGTPGMKEGVGERYSKLTRDLLKRVYSVEDWLLQAAATMFCLSLINLCFRLPHITVRTFYNNFMSYSKPIKRNRATQCKEVNIDNEYKRIENEKKNDDTLTKLTQKSNVKDASALIKPVYENSKEMKNEQQDAPKAIGAMNVQHSALLCQIKHVSEKATEAMKVQQDATSSQPELVHQKPIVMLNTSTNTKPDPGKKKKCKNLKQKKSMPISDVLDSSQCNPKTNEPNKTSKSKFKLSLAKFSSNFKRSNSRQKSKEPVSKESEPEVKENKTIEMETQPDISAQNKDICELPKNTASTAMESNKMPSQIKSGSKKTIEASKVQQDATSSQLELARKKLIKMLNAITNTEPCSEKICSEYKCTNLKQKKSMPISDVLDSSQCNPKTNEPNKTSKSKFELKLAKFNSNFKRSNRRQKSKEPVSKESEPEVKENKTNKMKTQPDISKNTASTAMESNNVQAPVTYFTDTKTGHSTGTESIGHDEQPEPAPRDFHMTIKNQQPTPPDPESTTAIPPLSESITIPSHEPPTISPAVAKPPTQSSKTCTCPIEKNPKKMGRNNHIPTTAKTTVKSPKSPSQLTESSSSITCSSSSSSSSSAASSASSKQKPSSSKQKPSSSKQNPTSSSEKVEKPQIKPKPEKIPKNPIAPKQPTKNKPKKPEKDNKSKPITPCFDSDFKISKTNVDSETALNKASSSTSCSSEISEKFEKSAKPKEFEKSAKPKEFEKSAKPKEFEKSAKPKEFEKSAKPKEFEKSAKPKEIKKPLKQHEKKVKIKDHHPHHIKESHKQSEQPRKQITSLFDSDCRISKRSLASSNKQKIIKDVKNASERCPAAAGVEDCAAGAVVSRDTPPPNDTLFRDKHIKMVTEHFQVKQLKRPETPLEERERALELSSISSRAGRHLLMAVNKNRCASPAH